MELNAFEVSDTKGWTLCPAPYQRQWMDETPGRGAYRCLPLTVANQAGWLVRGPFSFSATWNGAVEPEHSIRFQFDGDNTKAEQFVSSHFGNGIVTFRLPFLFQTPPGVGLLVRGAPNTPKINFHALEGLVETDWNPAPFTMNWKILESDKPVRFEALDAICFLQPFDLQLPEKLAAKQSKISGQPAIEQRFVQWRESRASFLKSEAVKNGQWQKDYFQGVNSAGEKVPQHRTAYRLSTFSRES